MIKVPLNASTFGEEEIQAAIDVLRGGQVTMASQCAQFEEAFAAHLGVKNAIFVNSGSSANLLAFFALANAECPAVGISGNNKRLRPGAEVIVPAVTWSTTIWPIVQAGCVPVLVDSDPETLQMDFRSVEAAISERTAAICPVHVLGNAVIMPSLLDIARQNKLWLIEDTCEALGTRQNGKMVGTFGDIGTFSFFFSHHITTIEGGMVITQDDDLAELFRCMRAHGWTRHLRRRKEVEAQYPEIDPRFLFINSGFNLRPTELNAAFGIHQIKKLEGFNKRRQEIAKIWINAFRSLIDNKSFVPMRTTPGTESTWFGFPILCETRQLRDRLQRHLETNGIETRPIICGNLARQPAFKKIPHRIAGELNGADQVMDRGLFWGSHPLMSDAEIEHVIQTVKRFFQ
ncbi:MAG: DegT/DnrJ/EryC1/StrS family aminotransferase [Oligoflexia bacterium]|nr:DegT/DnrJ/EryC1/StrS family aminotransferase [Oligoflexia bacterium]